nr:MAG TPA: hypothetical protein [Caudoviricetes sp.]
MRYLCNSYSLFSVLPFPSWISPQFFFRSKSSFISLCIENKN